MSNQLERHQRVTAEISSAIVSNRGLTTADVPFMTRIANHYIRYLASERHHTDLWATNSNHDKRNQTETGQIVLFVMTGGDYIKREYRRSNLAEMAIPHDTFEISRDRAIRFACIYKSICKAGLVRRNAHDTFTPNELGQLCLDYPDIVARWYDFAVESMCSKLSVRRQVNGVRRRLRIRGDRKAAFTAALALTEIEVLFGLACAELCSREIAYYFVTGKQVRRDNPFSYILHCISWDHHALRSGRERFDQSIWLRDALRQAARLLPAREAVELLCEFTQNMAPIARANL